jgi:hypothetical protein
MFTIYNTEKLAATHLTPRSPGPRITMPKKVQIFDELMEGFRDAIARKKGRHVALRVTEIGRANPSRPAKENRSRYDKAAPKL